MNHTTSVLFFNCLYRKKNILAYVENVSVLRKKGGYFCTQKVSVLIKIGVFFSLKIYEKGSFFKSENTDMSSLF